jgi:quercetin dioxygenase-like cupin family protein
VFGYDIVFHCRVFYKSGTMKLTRIYTGANGQSHFDEIEVEIEKLQPGEGIIFRHAPPGDFHDWHRAPRRQYVINLSGQSEIEIGDGTKRRFGPGDIFLVDDTTGRGYISRAVGSQPRLYVTIPVK